MIKGLIEGALIESPWPVWVQNKLLNGSKVKAFDGCTTGCRERNVVGVSSCEHNLFQVTRLIDEQFITVSDIYLHQDSNSKKAKRNSKLKEQKASLESINTWFTQVENKLDVFKQLIENQAKKRFDPFHEFVKWSNEIEFYSKRLVSKDGFDKSSEDLKSLYKTSIMLKDSLDTTALYVNPESASFGRKRKTDVYSMTHKISNVLCHSRSKKTRIKINFMGRVANQHRVYESFKIIPLTLLQNAIKYRKRHDIDIVFDERGDDLDFSVISYGDLLLPNEIERLFDRGFRTQAAKKMNVEGSGLGLYALKVVAEAHDFKVRVRSELQDTDTFKVAKNIFTVSIF